MQLVDYSERDSISAVLIVKNEEAFIERALNSLTWCDEIIVVDAQSTDRTQEICNNPVAPWSSKLKFYSQAWLGFSEQRNFAMDKADSKWVFFLDGDECCSPPLALKIQQILKDHSREDRPIQYKIHRQEFFLGTPIHYGIWNPSYHVRLFKRGSLQFVGTVHEGIRSDSETEIIHESIIHVEHLTIERFLTKLNHYTTLQAKRDFDSGMRTHLLKIVLAFPAMFYKNLIYYRAYRDGKAGFIISVLEGISRTVRHLKIWQLQQRT